MIKTVTVTDFLSDIEIGEARKLYKEHAGTGDFNAVVVAEIIGPNIERINRKLGGSTDVRYLGFAVEHFLSKEGKP
jgi:hypothetical protein